MRRILLNIIAALWVLSTVACTAAGNYGSTRGSTEVDRMFHSGPIPAEYHYYYYGWESEPTAILGIRNEYSLQAKYWNAVDLDAQRMKRWRAYFIQSIGTHDERAPGRLGFGGYRLMDPQGKDVGILYSRYDWTLVRFPGKNVVTVYPPQLMNSRPAAFRDR